MKEPIYNYIRGKGWIPTISNLLPIDEYRFDWWERKPNWWYPKPYRTGKFRQTARGEIQVGDFIPFGNYGWLVLELLGLTGARCAKIWCGDGEYELLNYNVNADSWEGVASL